MASKKVAIMLAPGTEDLEFVATVDVLRRGGIIVQSVSLQGKGPVKCSRETSIMPDTELASINSDDFDGIVLAGGPGVKALIESQELGKLLKEFEAKGKVIGAICGGPTALAAHSIGLGKKITSYPTDKDKLVDKYNYDDESAVVQDGQFVTSKSPGTAILFGLKLIHVLVNEAKAKEVAKIILVEY